MTLLERSDECSGRRQGGTSDLDSVGVSLDFILSAMGAVGEILL